MKKLTKIAAAFAVVLLLPTMALAHNNGEDKNNGNGINIKNLFHQDNKDKTEFRINDKFKSGTVTAISSTGFNFTTSEGVSFSVNTEGAKITRAFDGKIELSGIHVNDKVRVVGSLDGSNITAKVVVVTPANTHVAKGGGKVTAVNGNVVTVQTNNHGIPSTFTVTTDSSTVIKQNGSTTTLASVQVGSKISVKGLWDELVNTLKAIKIKIW